MAHRAEVAVLGAGLSGAGVALELARRGIAVTLIERDERAINRASLRNEGKIHLGLIYANDRTLRTAALQLQGALRFRSVLTRWIGADVDALHLSSPFIYGVAEDSICPLDQLEDHYARVQSMYEQLLRDDPALDYLGRRPNRLWHRRPAASSTRHLASDRWMATFETEELAIHPDRLAQHVRQAIARCDLIRFMPRHRVASVRRIHERYRIEGQNPTGAWRIDAGQVVNALWEGRLAIDSQLGLDVAAGWVHRLKYRVIARLPEDLRRGPSLTMVLGRYGDVVVRPDGSAYLSWYPAGLRGWSREIEPPQTWDSACRGVIPDDARSEIAHSILHGLDAWYPGIARAVPIEVDAGVIVAYGDSDVDDRNSGLHDRSRIGVTSADGYHSIEPGKLTTAPMFSLLAAQRVALNAASRMSSSVSHGHPFEGALSMDANGESNEIPQAPRKEA